MTTNGHRPAVCPLCAGTTFREVEPGFARCRACGLFQQATSRDAAVLQAEADRRYAITDRADAKPLMNCQGCEGEIAFLTRVCPDLLDGGRALDVGTALGDFVACLGASGMTASGIEPDRGRAEIGRKHGLDVREGRFGSASGAVRDDERFDLISMRESIYYFDDFADALATVRRMLTTRGALYIKSHVADSPYYWAGVPRSRRVGPQCTAFFNRRQLMALLHKHGFAVVATEHNDFPAVYAAEAWGLSLGLLARTGSLFSRLARMMPPDRLMILARPVATSG